MAETRAGSSRNLAVDEFSPMKISVLAVDDDAVCLKMLEGLLLACGYQVTVAQHATTALELLRGNKGSYDLVISDVKMPDMDGFKLSEIIGFEMDLPVIMLSIDSEVKTVIKGIKYGACDYLVKPVRIEELRLIWKHVMKKALQNTKGGNDATDKPDTLSKLEEDNTSNSTRKLNDQTNDKEDESSDSDGDPSTQKRPRINWSGELHAKFIDAINKLGLDRAVPKQILDRMDVPWITRENVSSHLQKYRKALKKNSLLVSQQYHGRDGSSGYGANTANSLLLSFNNQGLNVSSLGGYRVEGYQNQQGTIPLGQIQQSCIGHNPMTPTYSPLTLSQPSKCTPTLFINYPGRPIKKSSFWLFIKPFGYGNRHSSSATKHTVYQSLVPRLSQPSSLMENSSQIKWPVETNSWPNLINQSGNVPNQPGAGSIFEHNSHQGDLKETFMKETFTAGLDSLAPMQYQSHQFDARTGELLGMGTQVDGDSVVPESSEQKQSKGTISLELLAPFLESPQWERMFHLSDSDSADDLHSVLKQFQGTKETTDEDDFWTWRQ